MYANSQTTACFTQHRESSLSDTLLQDDKYLQDEDAHHFGCDPDINAWYLIQNSPPKAPKGFRSGGAHIHVGTEKGWDTSFLLEYEKKADFIKIMDYIIGISSTIIDFSQAAVDRRLLYGKSGAFRETYYGVEYRVLSNFWMKSPTSVSMIYHLVDDCLKLYLENKKLPKALSKRSEELMKIIDNGIWDKADKIFNEEISKIISEESVDLVLTVRENINSYDLYSEWGLI